MKANPDKFQAICLGKKANENITSFNISNTDIQCEDNVTLLGVNIDFFYLNLTAMWLIFVKRPQNNWLC